MTNKNTSVRAFIENIINDLKLTGHIRTSETYQCALNCFMRFRSNKDLQWQEITPKLLKDWEGFMQNLSLSPNTTSFYMRIMRAIYNKAASNHIAPEINPFINVYTGVAKTIKRALIIKEIRLIRDYETSNPQLAFARDMFMFSFYTQGMSWVDMAYLKPNDIKNGVLVYERKKTKQLIAVNWEQPMQNIVDRYHKNNTPYLLPIIKLLTVNHKERNQYRYLQTEVNKNLKIIAQDIGLQQKLSMYVARHSWASAANEQNVPIDVISQGMGHTSTKTTKIYINSINSGALKDVNRHIISLMEK
ncbi:MAG: site-specific integrase [Muribaculaceae bacterium]|nr:site-specific integrase [Muribaculaceae bacterium]